MIIRKAALSKASILKRLPLFTQRFRFPEKWKGGRLEKWSQYWEGLYLDYKSVAKDIVEEAKAKPKKAVLISSGLGVLFAAVKSNPGERSFYDHLISCITDLAMVADPIRNPQAEEHIRFLTQCQNQGLLRCINFIFFTLMWTADYSKDCDMYSAQCKYLKPKYTSFHERIVDVGVFGTWLNLKLKMKDFDVNPNEWAHTT